MCRINAPGEQVGVFITRNALFLEQINTLSTQFVRLSGVYKVVTKNMELCLWMLQKLVKLEGHVKAKRRG